MNMKELQVKILLGESRKGEKGYFTVDIGGEADYKADLNEPLTIFSEETVDGIGAFHLIEHLRPTMVEDAIKSWVNTLKKGGLLIIECPDFDSVIEWYLKDKSLLAKQWIFGNDSRVGQNHLWGFNKQDLKNIFDKLPVRYSFAEPQDYHKAEGPCLRIEAIKL